MTKRLFILFFTFITCLNCGLGTFENDSDTWQKVFGEDAPKQVEIINSRFWKSAHWTYEFEVFIKFNASKKFMNDYFINHYNLINPSKEEYHLLEHYFFDKPIWFQPKTYEDYKIWISQDKFKDTKLFVDKKTKIIFFHYSQT